MRYYKITNNGYISAIGTGAEGTEITESEYDEIMTAIKNKPHATATTDYLLKEDLTWEMFEREPSPEPEDDDLDDTEALNIILGEE